MSDSEATPKLRRSTRERKVTKLFSKEPKIGGRKRKRDTDEEGGNATDKTVSEGLAVGEDHEDSDGDENEENADDYAALKSKPKQIKTSGGTNEPKAKAKITPTKKVRMMKHKGDASVRRTKPDPSIDIAVLIKESHVSDDNALFLSILNPSSSLQSVVEDFLESLSASPELALADLITCILRASGCNETLSSDDVANIDGVVDMLDTYTDNLKQRNVPPYPLASKLTIFKKLRKQLSDFFRRLISASAELDSLYTSDLLPTLVPWVSTMSSSQLRSFRHTATVIAMELLDALCMVAAEVEKEHTLVTRQREGEKKRAGKNKGKSRDKEFQAKAEEVRKRKAKLAEYIEDFFNGVFVHRYRDHDPNIRAECVQAMGSWFKSHPSQFLDGRYFRYVGWVLSDTDSHVRLAAVKALHILYLSSSGSAASIQSFTDRFKGRLVQMATSDLELSIRVAALQTLSLIDKASLLEEEQRDDLCLLIYDEEPRVRKVVAGFVQGVWTEVIDERMSEHSLSGNKKDKERVGLKCLASLLVKWGKRTRQGLLQSIADDGEIDEESEDTKNRDVMRLVDAQQKGRIALAVDALWEDMPAVADWEALLDYLLLDHSASESNDVVGPSSRRVAKKSTEDEHVDDAWRLTEPEETALLQLFVASLRKARDEALVKKAEGETTLSDMTRALIKALPRLFAKHQSDPNRIADVLLIPPLMNLDLYLEMRMVPAYESLWDDIIKQFNSHSSPITLSHATATIQHLISARLLTNTNTTKQLELEEELSTSLRDAVAGREELEMAEFSEDEIHKLGAITSRLVALTSFRDMTQWMEEDEGGKQSSAWDIMNALAGRGRLGFKEEEVMIEECLRLLTLHLAWKSRNLTLEPELTEDATKYKEVLEEQRNSVLEKVVEFAVGKDSKPCEGVKRAAFHNLLDLHILFNGAPDTSPSALPLTMDDQTQYRCAGFVQAELEQFADDLEDPKKDLGHTTDEDASRAGSTTGDEDVNDKRDQNVPQGNIGREHDDIDPRMLPRVRLEREYILNALLATFIRALRVGVLNASHSAVVLAQYGRFGIGFDSTIKVVIEFIRDLGMFKDEGHLVNEIIVRALQESFNLFMDDVVHTDEYTVALARALTACFAIRGAQLSIVKRLEAEHIVNIHKNCISWIIKRCAGYDAVKNRKLLRHAVLFFRSLQQLLSTIESRDALTIKAHLDQYVAQVKLQIGSTKIWDPYRSYEKRLTSIMQKDKSIPVTKGRRRKKGDKSGTEDEGDERVESAGSATEGDPGERRRRVKPRPKRTPRRRGSVASTGNEGDDEDAFGSVSRPPRTRSPSKRLTTQKVKAGQDTETGEAEGHVNGNSPAEPVMNGHGSSPSSLRKRRRSDAGDSERDDADGPELGAEQSLSPARSNVSAADTRSRRKRIRR